MFGCLSAAEAKTTKNTASSSGGSSHHKTSGKASSKKTSSKSRGQAAPNSDRTREIQTALIREHYMSGEPTGSWDNQTRDALTKFQADNGWQTKLVPDSRALIKLGLGPSREGLLNPDTAAISPHELGAEKPQPGGSASN
ncbi:Peptidoglycan-binding domain 1 [Candidatus Koribacter versatilis Ellin345]|uniref:Peptidoglycan-binding domain 1 n=1 Tax=Koribacter versatilis (strain Ellin345) TaxID=204669 RepID=Q1IRR4_KORVE|nr:peptidoglycan-binding domain-containing protein [Candidatus Koribacter versatilis]ABF40436.1 Peptidoglycan-binding domain 1 [Candidatus Koribacter versatilis Ellin345]